MMQIIAVVAAGLFMLIAAKHLFALIEAPEETVRDIPKSGIPRVGRPCGFDQ